MELDFLFFWIDKVISHSGLSSLLGITYRNRMDDNGWIKTVKQ